MRTGSITSLAVVAAMAMASPASADSGVHAAGSCRPAWTLAAIPGIPGGQGVDSGVSAQVDSVSMLQGGRAWFAGEVDGLNAMPWVLRWDGHSIRPVTQIPQNPLDEQTGGPGSFRSASDGWMLAQIDGPAVSEARGGIIGVQGNGMESPSAEHWLHGHWTLTPFAVSPHPQNTGTEVASMATESPANAWAVGALYLAKPGVTAGAVPTGALIEHWNGTSWRVVPDPAAASPGGELSAVTAVSPANIWAVGQQRSSRGTVVPLILHWNGRSWDEVTSPVGSGPSALTAVSADGSKDVWAVGAQTEPGTGNVAIPLVEHWSGGSWTKVAPPSMGNALLLSVYAASPADVWATVERPNTKRAVFVNFDGRAWHIFPVPGPQEYGLTYIYSSIDGTGPRAVWAAGSVTSDYSADTTPLIARLCCR